jgi:tetratricopeptide (TPR) repeat protein
VKENVEQYLLARRCAANLVTHDLCRVKVTSYPLYLSCLFCLFAALVISASRGEAKTAIEVFKQVSKSVVVIKTYDEKGKFIVSGSGVVIDKDGNVVTNYHVIERAAKLIVAYDKKEYRAAPQYIDRIRDVCTLSVRGLNAEPVSLGNTSKIEIGSTVYAIGYPMAVGLTFSDGMVSSLRETTGGHYIQFTAPISSGSSGGGLFDEHAQLIGIPTYFISQGQLLNFALPVEWIVELPHRHITQSSEYQKPDKIDADYLRQAVALGEKEDWVAQIQLCERWTKALPKVVRAWELLGFAYANNGELAKAIGAFRQAIQLNPDSVQYWLELGHLYGRTRQEDKQTDSYRMAVRINPENASAWYKLAVVYRDAGKFSNALEAAQQVTRINPAHVSAWMIMGYSYGKLDQQTKEIDAYLQAIHIDEYLSDAYVCLGVAYGKDHRKDDEEESYQQALRVNPDMNTALFNLGHYYMRQGNKEKGMNYYSRLKTVDPEMAKMFFDDLSYRAYPETVQQQ